MIQTGFLYNDFIANLKQLFENNPTVELKWREGDIEKSTIYPFGLQGICEIDASVIPQFPFICLEFAGAKEASASIPYSDEDVTLVADIHYYAEEAEREVNIENIRQALWGIVALLRRNNKLGGFCRESRITDVFTGEKQKASGWIQGGAVRFEAIIRTDVF